MIPRRFGTAPKHTRSLSSGRTAAKIYIGTRMQMAEVQVHGISVLPMLTIQTQIPIIYGAEGVQKNHYPLHLHRQRPRLDRQRPRLDRQHRDHVLIQHLLHRQ